MRAIAAIALGALLLGGAASAAPSRHVINGVNVLMDLRALGTEPFWMLEVTDGGLRFAGPDIPESQGPLDSVSLTEGRAQWSTTTADRRWLRLTVTGEDCSDGMSDRTYPLTAKVELGDEIYNGCAATIDALVRTRGQESGEVR